MSEMIEVAKHDANNYCRVLQALGMEEEGDPVAEINRLVAIEAAAKTLRKASGVVLAAQIRTHGDGETLNLPLPREYANEMKVAMDAQAALYRLLDADVLFNHQIGGE